MGTQNMNVLSSVDEKANIMYTTSTRVTGIEDTRTYGFDGLSLQIYLQVKTNSPSRERVIQILMLLLYMEALCSQVC
jgi:hypothetical protein